MVLPFALTGGLAATFGSTGCSSQEPTKTTYFERTVGPILTNSCSRTVTGAGCHVATPKGNAFGNLDTTTFEMVAKRRDLLLNYGPYGQSAFLLKAAPPSQLELQSYDGEKIAITTDIKHTGGPIFDPAASGYQVLRRWIENGATENNGGPPPVSLERTACNSTVPREAGFDPNVDPVTRDFATFRDRVAPVLQQNCAAGNCHGTKANELYLTCGNSPQEVRWNYHAAREYLSTTPEQSELLRRPLSPQRGGAFHEGGVIFEAASDEGYAAMRAWATEHGPLVPPQADASFRFFSRRVQPVLAKKGCMMVQCHSASMFHDYRLRGGSGGAFSYSATRRNYELSLLQLNIESEDVNASRLVRKNLYRPEVDAAGRGVAHRGGPLFEDFGADVASGARCDAANPPYDYENGKLDEIPGYCIVRRWLQLERERVKPAPLSGIVYVRRPVAPAPNRVQDFDVYAPGAELRLARASLQAATGNVELRASEEVSLNAGCGLNRETADIRRPSVSWDGAKIAFAARASAQEPLAIYEMNADGSNCQKHPEINAGPASANGLLIHNFDPAYSPPDKAGVVRIVFASTRGNLRNEAYDYTGPQRTPADPSKPNSNIYVFEPNPGGGNRVRQLTFLLNMEREPAFMADGRVIMTAEKRAPNFYQLALRRVNLDGGDYHPLFAQRGSVGFLQATSVVETTDRNFVAIFSDPGVPHNGGAIGVINRSIGIDFQSGKPEDYPIDPSVIDPTAPASPEPNFFLRSLRFPDGGATGRVGKGGGVYANPSPLPGGKVLVSYVEAPDAGTHNGDYDLFVLDTISGQRVRLLGAAGAADVEAVAIYGRASHGVFESTFDEPNGHTQIFEGKSEADLTFLNVPVLSSLLFQNTPTGRPLENDTPNFELFEDMPPPPDVTTMPAAGPNVVSDAYGKVYVRRRSLGTVPVLKDGSARVQIPGGLPFLFKLPDSKLSSERKWPRFQREAYVFAPGEYAHQSFRPGFFNSMCGQCHGALSGRNVDVSVLPDMLTQASRVMARSEAGTNLNKPPAQRGPIVGAP